MPEVDFAILCHSAIESNSLISLLKGPIDTIETDKIPWEFPITLVVRFLWTLGELNREHIGEIVFQDEDGEQLIKIDFRTKLSRPKDAITGWPIGTNLILNFPLHVSKYGNYSFEILVDNKNVKSLPFRAKKSTK